jgi:tetratricopeptide (TPR) repeat protein
MTPRIALAGLLLTGLLIAAGLTMYADSPADTGAMMASNELYDAGRYAESAQVYEQIVDQGYQDSALYYNLGNAYYKQGDLGRAILNYVRAERLAPRDADVRANLELARAQTIDLLGPAERSLPARLAAAVQSRLTTNELAAATLALWFLLTLPLAIALFGKPGGLRRASAQVAAVLGLVLVLGAVTLLVRVNAESDRQGVVVVAETVDVVSGPGPQYVTEFALHAGAEARLIERRGSWARLALPDGGLQGWVPVSAVEDF